MIADLSVVMNTRWQYDIERCDELTDDIQMNHDGVRC